MPTDLNDRIATEVMGYVLDSPICGIGFEYWLKDGMLVCERERWKPLEDLNQCALAEAEIERRGMWESYRKVFHELAIHQYSSGIRSIPNWYTDFLIRLTPEQRCAAMLAAVGAKP